MRIAVADDEKLVLYEMVYLINEAVPGAQIDAFQSPLELIEKAESVKYDVAFLDIQMPGSNGVDTAKALREKNPGINIIFVTSFSEYTRDAIRLHASGYLKKPATVEEIKSEIDNLLFPVGSGGPRVRMQAFGNFCVFVGGKPVHFGRARELEILAYLVDRRGAPVSRKEIASMIFEDGDFSRNQQIYLSQIVHDLIEDLTEAGIGDILLRKSGNYCVDTSKFTCDAYEFLQGDPAAQSAYGGEYMEQFSWAEYLKGKFEKK